MRFKELIRIIIWDPHPPGRRPPEEPVTPPTPVEWRRMLFSGLLLTGAGLAMSGESFYDMSIWSPEGSRWWSPYAFTAGVILSLPGLISLLCCMLALFGRREQGSEISSHETERPR